MKTKVKFLIHKDPTNIIGQPVSEKEDLFAYFPEENSLTGMSDREREYKTAYAHVGQHSLCHPEYASESRNATPAEYADLKAELESIGYNLEII